MVGPSVAVVGLVAAGHSAQLEHIVADYESRVGSESEPIVGSDFALSVGSVLGT